MGMFKPAYLKLIENDELNDRVKKSYEMLSNCDVCGWHCGVNRIEDEFGVCHTGKLARISSYGPHMGEEDPLRGRRGSGTIFFGQCNLRCQYCQNYDISQYDSGREIESEDLAGIMLGLQRNGCHNINFVSCSHVVPQIISGRPDLLQMYFSVVKCIFVSNFFHFHLFSAGYLSSMS